MLGYKSNKYIFEDEDLYFNESKKYSLDNPNRRDFVLKTKYHLSRLVLEKKR